MAGVSQRRAARIALGQDGGPARGRGGSSSLAGGAGGAGVPAAGERAGDQGLVAADGEVGADLELGPAEFVVDLLVALFDPVLQAVEPDELGRVRA